MLPSEFQRRLHKKLDSLTDEHRLRPRRTVIAQDSTTCTVDGQICVNFASNDYLGLAFHPETTAAFAEAAGTQAGSTASALVAGRTDWHCRLETELRCFEEAEGVLLFPSGFAANLGTLTSLVTANDAVFCDRDNHASIIDGCRAADGRMFVYHRDSLDHLAASLERRRNEYDQLFIVTDTVFSMDGVLAPLPRLCDIAESTGAVLIVDEAHGTGIFGSRGQGVCELMGVHNRVPVRIGTLSKAVGAMGGFVAGDSNLIDVLWNTARTQFFSTALPPAVCAAAVASLRVMRRDQDRLRRLHDRCQLARQIVADRGLVSIDGSQGPIVPIVTGADDLAVEASQKLMNAGFFVPAIRPPTVPTGTARLRMSINCEHSESQIEQAVSEICKAVN